MFVACAVERIQLECCNSHFCFCQCPSPRIPGLLSLFTRCSWNFPWLINREFTPLCLLSSGVLSGSSRMEFIQGDDPGKEPFQGHYPLDGRRMRHPWVRKAWRRCWRTGGVILRARSGMQCRGPWIEVGMSRAPDSGNIPGS